MDPLHSSEAPADPGAELGEVRVNGVRVGLLHRLPEGQETESGDDHILSFDQDWLADPQRPILGQQFERRRSHTLSASGLFAWFAHLLPPAPQRRRVCRWARLDEDAPDLSLLLAIGADLYGAVTVLPVTPSGATRPPSTESQANIGFGLPGVQWKLSIRPGERGLVVPWRGEGGDFIAKFHDPQHPRLPQVEAATTQWARLSGLHTHQSRLAQRSEFGELPEGTPLGDGHIFLATRFDRLPGGGRVHAEDFAQVSGLTPYADALYRGHYETLAATVTTLCPQDAAEYVDRLVFMLLSGNGDAHWKNWGLLYPDGRHARLCPAYDLVSTVVYSASDDLALTLGGTRCFAQVHPAQWDTLARTLNWDHAELLERARRTRERVQEVWATEKTALGLEPREIEAIERHMASLMRW